MKPVDPYIAAAYFFGGAVLVALFALIYSLSSST